MKKNVFILGETGGFLFKAIVNGLVANGYKVDANETIPETILTDSPDIIMIYLSEDLVLKTRIYEVLNSLSAVNPDVKLYLIGSQTEIEEVYITLRKEAVTGEFYRPINIQEISQRLEEDELSSSGLEQKKKILLVDDDTIALRTMEQWLSANYRVFISSSGTDAIEFLRNKEVDLILLDFEMPVMSGPQVMRSIQNNPAIAATPIMFLTSKNDMDSVKKAVSMKPERYLLKSMPKENLIEIIDGFFA
ncbi:MAG: response regulator, partial [Butyrivibrio sp.]|nr:response regulator [Butyrivibrio sp.]